MIGHFETLKSYIQAWRFARDGLDRALFEEWQQKKLTAWLHKAVPKVAFYDGSAHALKDLPIIDKEILMGAFDQFNLPAIKAHDVISATSGRIGKYMVGTSTGTSGNRGCFVITQQESYRWLGAILAKALGDKIAQRHRIAVILPRNSGLYDNARRSPILSLQYFDIASGPESWRSGLEAFDPSVIVAPPKILSYFATENYRLRPNQLFSAAETLDPKDRTEIEAAFDRPLGQIYMATEGLLAVSCSFGTLHLAEDSTAFEFENVGDGLVSPLISCFGREAQIMARYRMNDLLRLGGPCPCGSSLQAVEEVIGRMDDVFHLPLGLITPDVLRNAVVGAHFTITDFRIIQTSTSKVDLVLPPNIRPDVAQAAAEALQSILAPKGATLSLRRDDLRLDLHRKRRRVIGWHGTP